MPATDARPKLFVVPTERPKITKLSGLPTAQSQIKITQNSTAVIIPMAQEAEQALKVAPTFTPTRHRRAPSVSFFVGALLALALAVVLVYARAL